MNNEIRYISKIEIKKLWGDDDLNFEWNLNPDVNILAGENGSGKSTILDLIFGVIREGLFINPTFVLVDKIKISFDNEKSISFQKHFGNPTLNIEAGTTKNIKYIPYHDNPLLNISIAADKLESGIVDFGDIPFGELNEILPMYFINTLDTPLRHFEYLRQFSQNQLARTELDFTIISLEKLYLSYQIDIGKRAISALKNGTSNLQEVDAKIKLFWDTVDELFSATNKRIERTINEIVFIKKNDKTISPFQLSSGEKQILIILLAALVQDNQPCVMIMDEPEISLHVDWQEDLISNIRKLNENVQIIIATHSPFIVSKGWASDKYVFQMEDIKTKHN